MFRPWVRRIFAGLHALPLMDRLHFHLSVARYARGNRRFRNEHPDFALPPDAFLHETYRLDYAAYARDGWDTARELLDRCRPYLPQGPTHILDWGCGVARITRHLPMLPGIRSVTGADVNEGMIRWNRTNIPGIDFQQVSHEPPTPFAEGRFGLILAVSVLTHVPAGSQAAWLQEAWRILAPGGILVLTTQGRAFLPKLSPSERRRLKREGVLTRAYPVRGHRMMSSFHDPDPFRSAWQAGFEGLDFCDGSVDREAAGGQDLWVLRKKKHPTGNTTGLSAKIREAAPGDGSAYPVGG